MSTILYTVHASVTIRMATKNPKLASFLRMPISRQAKLLFCPPHNPTASCSLVSLHILEHFPGTFPPNKKGATHVILRRYLPHEIISHNWQLLHYILSHFGYICEEEKRKDAADNAEGSCCDAEFHSTAGGYAVEVGRNAITGDG